jgi:hypothetical protein
VFPQARRGGGAHPPAEKLHRDWRHISFARVLRTQAQRAPDCRRAAPSPPTAAGSAELALRHYRTARPPKAGPTEGTSRLPRLLLLGFYAGIHRIASRDLPAEARAGRRVVDAPPAPRHLMRAVGGQVEGRCVRWSSVHVEAKRSCWSARALRRPAGRTCTDRYRQPDREVQHSLHTLKGSPSRLPARCR